MDEYDWISDMFLKMHHALCNECMRCFHFNRVLIGDDEDHIQDVMVKALKHKKEWMSSPNPEGWLMVCCRNHCESVCRRELRRAELQQFYQNDLQLLERPVTDAINLWIEQQDYELLRAELEGKLTPLEFMVYQEYYIDHLSKQQISNKHHLSDNMIRAALQRIRRKARLLPKYHILLILMVLLSEVTH